MTEQKKPEERVEPSFDMPDPPPESQPQPSPEDVGYAFDADFAASDLKVQEESEALRAEIAGLNDQLLRALAEAENTRRRAERDKQDTARYAVGNFAKAVLSVADNMSRALQSVTPEQREADPVLKNLCIGLDYTMNELMNAYQQFGIKPIDALGKKFDANYHQAMFELEDASVPAGTVVQEVQKGYMIHDRLLRPAMVGVSKGGQPQNVDKAI
jgi:molecular chaperone GrpE